jgi:hypothetical protein
VASALSVWSARHVRWASLEAAEIASGAATGQVKPDYLGNPIERRRWWRQTYSKWPLFLRAFLYWFYRYFVKLGFLDGKEGLVFHFLQGLWFRFLVDAMILESTRTSRPGVVSRLS